MDINSIIPITSMVSLAIAYSKSRISMLFLI
jgi:hypothetical protein